MALQELLTRTLTTSLAFITQTLNYGPPALQLYHHWDQTQNHCVPTHGRKVRTSMHLTGREPWRAVAPQLSSAQRLWSGPPIPRTPCIAEHGDSPWYGHGCCGLKMHISLSQSSLLTYEKCYDCPFVLECIIKTYNNSFR